MVERVTAARWLVSNVLPSDFEHKGDTVELGRADMADGAWHAILRVHNTFRDMFVGRTPQDVFMDVLEEGSHLLDALVMLADLPNAYFYQLAMELEKLAPDILHEVLDSVSDDMYATLTRVDDLKDVQFFLDCYNATHSELALNRLTPYLTDPTARHLLSEPHIASRAFDLALRDHGCLSTYIAGQLVECGAVPTAQNVGRAINLGTIQVEAMIDVYLSKGGDLREACMCVEKWDCTRIMPFIHGNFFQPLLDRAQDRETKAVAWMASRAGSWCGRTSDSWFKEALEDVDMEALAAYVVRLLDRCTDPQDALLRRLIDKQHRFEDMPGLLDASLPLHNPTLGEFLGWCAPTRMHPSLMYALRPCREVHDQVHGQEPFAASVELYKFLPRNTHLLGAAPSLQRLLDMHGFMTESHIDGSPLRKILELFSDSYKPRCCSALVDILAPRLDQSLGVGAVISSCSVCNVILDQLDMQLLTAEKLEWLRSERNRQQMMEIADDPVRAAMVTKKRKRVRAHQPLYDC